MMPSGHKAFLVSNVKDVELLMMHNKVYAAEWVVPLMNRSAQGRFGPFGTRSSFANQTSSIRIAHNVSSRKRIEIISRAKELGVKVTNPKAKVTTEV